MPGRGRHPDHLLLKAVYRRDSRVYDAVARDRRRSASRRRRSSSGEAVERRSSTTGPYRRAVAHDRGRRVLGVRRHRRARRDAAHAAALDRLPRAARHRVPARVRRAAALLRRRHAHDDDGERPHRRVRGARGALDPAVRARRVRPPPAPLARGRHQVLRARRVLLGDLPVRRRARLRRHRHHLARRASRRSSRTSRCSTRARCSPGSCSCSSGSASRSRRCRSTCGRPTSTRARRPRSPRSWRRPRRPPGSPRCCGCCSPRSTQYQTDWRTRDLGARGPDAPRSAASPRCVQTDLKRMLAYSSISHAGYVLIGVAGRDARRACVPRSSTCSSTRS